MFRRHGARQSSDPAPDTASLFQQALTLLPQMSMRFSVLAVSAAALALFGCQKATAPDVPPTYHLKATVTASNNCSVSVEDKEFSSIGQIRGDVPTDFIGTVPEKSYHGFGCWVATTGGDGDLIVLFSGNNLGKPLALGTYPLTHEVIDNTPLGMAAITFRSSMFGDKLRTMDNAVGNVIVEKDASGSIVIRVDAEVVRWGEVF
jgi:hypothetical protein